MPTCTEESVGWGSLVVYDPDGYLVYRGGCKHPDGRLATTEECIAALLSACPKGTCIMRQQEMGNTLILTISRRLPRR